MDERFGLDGARQKTDHNRNKEKPASIRRRAMSLKDHSPDIRSAFGPTVQAACQIDL